MNCDGISDVHTHNPKADTTCSVRNLTMDELPAWLEGNAQGYFSAGIHPWDAHLTPPFDLIASAANDPRLWAIGECGLDKNATADMKRQMALFEPQIELALTHDKHLIIHCVKAWDELIRLYQKHHKKNEKCMWIIHGFRGNSQLATQLLKLGFKLSINYKRKNELLQKLPAVDYFFETDEDY